MYRLPRSLTLRQQPPTHLLHRPPRIPRIQRRSKSQYLYQSTGEPVRFRTVRFKKHPLTLKRCLTIGIYTGVVWGYLRLMWRYMDVEVEFVDGEEEGVEAEKQEGGKDGGKGEEEKEDEAGGPPFYAAEENTFIPLTWSRKLPRTYYKGSDPEWQSFLSIAKDKTRHTKIQTELVQIVFSGSLSHPTISRSLGSNPKVGKYWLDISFPDGPPQEYERSGIEIGEGFVAWSQQRVSPEKQWRLMRALWPEAAARSSWATAKVLGGIQWRRFLGVVGLRGEVDPMSVEERWRLAAEMVKGHGNQKVGKSQTDPSSSPPQTRPSSDDSQSQKIPWLPHLPIPSSTSIGSPSNPSDNMDIPIAIHTFSRTLSKTWNPQKPLEPPRGTFLVQGLVEVQGKRGRMLFDVQSAYDPRQGRYVSVNAAVRGSKRWSQAPRGGP